MSAEHLSKSYLRLVREFPLTSIRDDAHLAAASTMLDRVLMLGEDDPGVVAYLDALSDLVWVYEQRDPITDGTAAGALAMVMEGRGLTQSRLAREVGIAQATISNVLRGVRDFTGAQAVRLGKYFSVEPGAFLPTVAEEKIAAIAPLATAQGPGGGGPRRSARKNVSETHAREYRAKKVSAE
jgi:transcriptional regulator with XRE-family HTH domain